MIFTNVLTLSLMLLAAQVSPKPGPGYKGIVPLHSTCEDVKRALGVSQCDIPLSTYDLEDAVVKVDFIQYACHEKWPYETWNVPPGTVGGIEIIPKKPLSLADFLKDNYYESSEGMDLHDEIFYANGEKGISLRTYKGAITSIYYMAGAKDAVLRCPTYEKLAKTYGIVRGQTLVKVYYDITFDEEKVILDEYARNLKATSYESEGYIVAYAGRKAHPREAELHAERLKDYLVNVRGVKASRIKTLDGGYHERPSVELHIGLLGMPEPIIEPTVHPSQVQIIDDRKTTAHN